MVSPATKAIQLGQFCKDMAELGYKVRTRQNSAFIAATVTDGQGIVVNSANVLTAEHFQKYKPFYDYRANHKVRDGDWIVTI